MSEIKLLRKTLRFTDEEWKMIAANAKKQRVSINQFIINSTTKNDEEDSLEHNVRMIKKGVNFLAELKKDEYENVGRKKRFDEIFDELE